MPLHREPPLWVKIFSFRYMRSLFHIEYFASLSEALYVVFNGGNSHQMHQRAEGQWCVECDTECGSIYHYELRDNCGALLREEALKHEVSWRTDAEVFDCWQDIPAEQPLYSSLFTECVFRRQAATVLVNNV